MQDNQAVSEKLQHSVKLYALLRKMLDTFFFPIWMILRPYAISFVSTLFVMFSLL